MLLCALAVPATPRAAHAQDNAAFVSQSVPAAMLPGKTYTVSVTLQNNGTTSWVRDVASEPYWLASYNPLNNMQWGLNRDSIDSTAPAVQFPITVAPSAQMTFEFTVTAPTTPGNYNFQWGMVNNGTAFGQPSPNTSIPVDVNAAPKVPQGRSAFFKIADKMTGSGLPGWAIYDPAGNSIATNSMPAGWAVSDTFTVTAPITATVAAGYQVRNTIAVPQTGTITYRSYFDVVPAPAAHIAIPGWAEHVLPTDSGGGGDASGPSAASSVNLASGVYEHNPGPDIWVRNPKGPDVTFTRSYSSAMALEGKSSPGLTAGWTHEYDLKIQVEDTATAPAWNQLKLVYPNGAADILNLEAAVGQTSVWEFTEVAGAPYFRTW